MEQYSVSKSLHSYYHSIKRILNLKRLERALF